MQPTTATAWSITGLAGHRLPPDRSPLSSPTAIYVVGWAKPVRCVRSSTYICLGMATTSVEFASRLEPERGDTSDA